MADINIPTTRRPPLQRNVEGCPPPKTAHAPARVPIAPMMIRTDAIVIPISSLHETHIMGLSDLSFFISCFIVTPFLYSIWSLLNQRSKNEYGDRLVLVRSM